MPDSSIRQNHASDKTETGHIQCANVNTTHSDFELNMKCSAVL